MPKNYSQPDHKQVATAIAVAWTIPIYEKCDIAELSLFFDVAPTTAEDVVVTIDRSSSAGSAYNGIVVTVDPINATTLTLRNIKGLVLGDSILVSYTNTDTRSITGVYTLDSGGGDGSGGSGGLQIIKDGVLLGADSADGAATITTATTSVRVEEIDPLSQAYVLVDLVDDTNIAANTYYYPAATGGSLDGYKDLSLSGLLVDADHDLTMTVEVTTDEDTTNGDWVQIYGADKKANDMDSSWGGVAAVNETFAIMFENVGSFSAYRVKIIAAGATNTVIIKGKLKAL